MRKKPFFYGWWIVLSCTIMALWTGSIFYGITVYLKPIADEFGWTYLAISLAASIRSVEMGLLAPVAGFLTDRFGPRKVTFLSCLMSGAGLLLLSRTDSMVMFYIAFFIIAVTFSGLGQAVTTTALANWFKKKIGRATGFSVAGYGLGGILIPLMAWLIIQYGWRLSLVILGLSCWVLVLPLSLILRHKPEQYGYTLDGEIHTSLADMHNVVDTIDPVEVEFTARHAIRTKIFWLLAFAFAIQFTVLQAVTLHIMPYCVSVNIPEVESSLVAMFIPLSSVVGRLSFGWLGDIFRRRYMLAFCLVFQALGLVFLYYGYSIWQLIAFLIFYGPTFGGTLVLRSAILREYFGRSAFGTIQGLILGVLTIGGIIGPSFAGWVFDVNGSYQVAWLAFAVAILVAALMILLIKTES